MTYTKSSELPKEDGYYWLKAKRIWSRVEIEIGKIEELLVEITDLEYTTRVRIFNSDTLMLDQFKVFYEPLAYCKIEKPEGGE